MPRGKRHFLGHEEPLCQEPIEVLVVETRGNVRSDKRRDVRGRVIHHISSRRFSEGLGAFVPEPAEYFSPSGLTMIAEMRHRRRSVAAELEYVPPSWVGARCPLSAVESLDIGGTYESLQISLVTAKFLRPAEKWTDETPKRAVFLSGDFYHRGMITRKAR